MIFILAELQKIDDLDNSPEYDELVVRKSIPTISLSIPDIIK